MVGVTGASLRVSVLVPDRRASKSPVTSEWWPCLWTVRTCLGAWMPRWLLEKPRHISETGWTWGLLASGQISPAVGPKYEQQDTKKGQNPTTEQCPEHHPCRQHLQGGGQITQHDPLTRPTLVPLKGASHLFSLPSAAAGASVKPRPNLSSGLWSISTDFEEPKNPSW